MRFLKFMTKDLEERWKREIIEMLNVNVIENKNVKEKRNDVQVIGYHSLSYSFILLPPFTSLLKTSTKKNTNRRSRILKLIIFLF